MTNYVVIEFLKSVEEENKLEICTHNKSVELDPIGTLEN